MITVSLEVWDRTEVVYWHKFETSRVLDLRDITPSMVNVDNNSE